MSRKRHQLAVFIGRFQPFHIGHRNVIAAAADHADSLLALVGSAFRPRSWKNPFRFDERAGFIAEGTADLKLPIHVLPLLDTLYDDAAWATHVRTAVQFHLRDQDLDPSAVEISLIGMEKDKSSAYLRWFPEWKMVPSAAHYHDDQMINATQMREFLFFEDGHNSPAMTTRFGADHLATVRNWMAQHPDAVAQIQSEGAFVQSYRDRIKASETIFGYPISINTADAIVVHSDHVLLVERKHVPGKGLWALPGGHIDADETAAKAALRELAEETGLVLSPTDLTRRHVFDHPDRSEKGWVRTEAFLYRLPDTAAMPKLKSGSDAAQARFVPISEITPDILFEDHFDILTSMLPDLPFSYASILMAHTHAT